MSSRHIGLAEQPWLDGGNTEVKTRLGVCRSLGKSSEVRPLKIQALSCHEAISQNAPIDQGHAKRRRSECALIPSMARLLLHHTFLIVEARNCPPFREWVRLTPSHGRYHRYISREETVKAKRARVFWTGRSQVIRLPRSFASRPIQFSWHRQGYAVIVEPADEWPAGYIESFGGIPDDFTTG